MQNDDQNDATARALPGDADRASEASMEQIGTTLLFENERVRIWEMKLAPGETGNLHRHDRDYVLVQIEGDRMAVVPEEGAAGDYTEYMEADVIPGQHFWIPRGGVERARNVGAKAYHEVLVELKN